MAATGLMRVGASPDARGGITITNTKHTVGSTFVRVAVQLLTRKGGVVINLSNVYVYYGYANTVTAAASGANTVGVIPPYGSLNMYDGTFLFTGDVYCICVSGDTAYMTFEEYT